MLDAHSLHVQAQQFDSTAGGNGHELFQQYLEAWMLAVQLALSSVVP